MTAVLIFPPVSDPGHPPLGISSLCGFLRSKGQTVQQIDFNILSYHKLLIPANIKRCGQRIATRLLNLEQAERLTPIFAEEYIRLAKCLLKEKYLAKFIEKALVDLRKPQTYRDRPSYAASARIVRETMEFVAAAYHPARWSPRTFELGDTSASTRNVLRFIVDRDHNFFIPFFESEISSIVQLEPKVVGISINYFCQLIPALTLARLVKNAIPGIVVVAGGGLISLYNGRWRDLSPFRHLIDFMVPFEGELPLFEIIKQVDQGALPGNIPGSVQFSENDIIVNRPRHNIAKIKPGLPDFNDLPLDYYISPGRILPFATSRGCYWGKCTFCSQHLQYRKRFTMKTCQQVFSDFKTLHAKYSTTEFYLVDEAIPPATALALSREIADANLPYRWFGEMRFETSLSKENLFGMLLGGCRMLMFGLESASPRIIKCMRKGITPQSASSILKTCGDLGINVFLMFFVGFPSETIEEAELTAQFVSDHKHHISHLGFSNFVLIRGTKIYESPHDFGIVSIENDSNMDLAIDSLYVLDQGISQKAALDLVEHLKNVPEITKLIDLTLLSRSHLAYLPAPSNTQTEEDKTDRISMDFVSENIPVLKENIVGLSLKFNLLKASYLIKDSKNDSIKYPVEPDETYYVYNPESDTILNIGEDGFLLVRLCNGKNKVADILSAVETNKREEVFIFLKKLFLKGFLN